ncbi:MAG: acyltransferase family protein [Bacteroidaceae bacterium]
MTLITKKQSDAFYTLKGIAIFFVFFAHLPISTTNEYCTSLQYLFNFIGIVGVPIFMLLAGFFAWGSHSSFKKKLTTLIIPLLVWGTITYALHCIKDSTKLSIISWLCWIYGCKTWLYFVPVLLWNTIMARYINIYVCVALGLLSILFTELRYIPYNDFFTEFTNPFNFTIYYVLGLFIRRFDLQHFLEKKAMIITGTVILIFYYIMQIRVSYFMFTCIPFCLSSYCLLYYISSRIKGNSLISIGKLSFAIYLSHIQIAGFVNSFFFKYSTGVFESTKAIIAFLFSFLFVYLVSILTKRYTIIHKALGFR